MPAATQLRRRINVEGSRRQVYATLTLPAAAAGTVTYDTKLHLIDFWSATAPDTNAIGGTVSGGIVTFQIAGAGLETPTFFTAEGF